MHRPLPPLSRSLPRRVGSTLGLALVAWVSLSGALPTTATAFELTARYGRGGVYRYTDAATEEFPAGEYDPLHAIRLAVAGSERRGVAGWAGISLRTYGGRLLQTQDRPPADLESQTVALIGGVRWTPESLRVGRAALFTEFGPALVWTRDVARRLAQSHLPDTRQTWSLGLEIAGGIGVHWRPGLRVDAGIGWSRIGRQTSALLDLSDRLGPSEYELFLGMTFRPVSRSAQG